jgi:hypothetical protein
VHPDWPDSNHGIIVDNKGYVWIGGNGQPDSHIMKFTRDGKFVAMFGKKGARRDPNNPNQYVRGADDLEVDEGAEITEEEPAAEDDERWEADVGEPELAKRGILRGGMEQRDTEGADAGERRCDVVYRPRCEAVRQQEDPDDAQRSGEDVTDLGVVVRAKRGLDMSVDGSSEEQRDWQSQPNISDNRPHVAVRQRWIFAPRRFRGQHRGVLPPG